MDLPLAGRSVYRFDLFTSGRTSSAIAGCRLHLTAHADRRFKAPSSRNVLGAIQEAALLTCVLDQGMLIILVIDAI